MSLVVSPNIASHDSALLRLGTDDREHVQRARNGRFLAKLSRFPRLRLPAKLPSESSRHYSGGDKGISSARLELRTRRIAPP